MLVPQTPKETVHLLAVTFSQKPTENETARCQQKTAAGKRVLSSLKAAWKEPYNKGAVSLYRDSLFELIRVVQLGLESEHPK